MQEQGPQLRNLNPEALTGQFEYRLDPKFRFTIPSRWFARMGFPTHVYVMHSLAGEPCLNVFAAVDFEKRMKPYENQQLSDADTAKFLRTLAAKTELVAIDAQNRVRVPDRMLRYAGLDGDIVMFGTGLHFEVWSAAKCPQSPDDEVAEIKAFEQLAREVKF